MTTLHVSLKDLSGDISLYEPSPKASVWLWPFSAYADGSDEVTKTILKTQLVAGVADIPVPQTPAGNALWVQIRGVRGLGEPWLIEIPASGTVNLVDRPHLDPTTLDPATPLDPAWLAGLEEALAAPVTKATKNARAFRTFHVALSKVASEPCDIAFLCGDSIQKGFTASSVDKRFVAVFRDALRARFQPAGVPGGAGFFDGANQAAFGDYPVTPSNPILDQTFGLGLDGLRMTSNAQFIAAQGVVTSIDVMFKGSADGSTGYLFWDNDAAGAPQSFNTANLADAKGGKLHRLLGPVTAAQHSTILYGGITPGDVVTEGFMLYNGDETKGIRVWEAGLAGRLLHDYIGNTSWLDSLATVQPALVVLPFGSNDYVSGRTSAQVKADALATIASIRSVCTNDPTIVLLSYYDRHQSDAVEPWANYVAAADSIAAADPDVAHYALDVAFGPYLADNRGGLVNSDPSDRVHPTDAGHLVIGSALVNFVSP